MEGQEKWAAGPPQKSYGEQPSLSPTQDFKLNIKEDVPVQKMFEMAQEQPFDSNKENITLKWAMEKVGKPAKTGDEAYLENILRASENDVYPLSIYFSQKSKRLMKITRFTVLLALFYFMVPFDLYITSTDYRIFYYGTALRNERISFSKDVTKTNNTFQFDLTNCEVNLYNDEEQGPSFRLEFGYEFGTQYEVNSSYLKINSNPTQTCIVNLYLPSAPIPLPQFRFNITGTQDNILFGDSGLNGGNLNFSRGLDIFGETAFVYISNHYVRELNISLQFSMCRLYHLRTQYRHIEIQNGIYSEIIDQEYSKQAVIIANQPEGNICIVSPALKEHPNNTKTCFPIYDSSAENPTNPFSKQSYAGNSTKKGSSSLGNQTDAGGNTNFMDSIVQLPETKCIIASIICANSEECSEETKQIRLRKLRQEQRRRMLKIDNKTTSLNNTIEVEPEVNPYEGFEIYYQLGIPISNVTVIDGTIQASFSNSQSSETYMMQKIQRIENTITFSKASLKVMNTTAGYFRSDEVNSRIHQLQTVGDSYKRNWLYTNKLPFLQAQYWPLVWGSAGLLRPILSSNKIILIDHTCPQRHLSLEMDIEVNLFYSQIYPQTHNSKIAFSAEYSKFFEIITNDFGQGKYKQITLSENPMMISAFAISGCIAILGGLGTLWNIFLSLKRLRQKYQLFLTKQTQLAITIKQKQLSNDEVDLDNQQMLEEFQKNQKYYEVKSVFTNQFESYEIQKNAMDDLQFSYSIYQISFLLFDKFMRMKLNSLHQFLHEIQESTIHFTLKKMNQYDKTDISMPFYEFQQIYSSFCSKYGFTEIENLEIDGDKIFEQFALNLVTFEDKLEPAYINLRFKTMSEKSSAGKDEGVPSSAGKEGAGAVKGDLSISKKPIGSSVLSFLQKSCIYSQFESDLISFEEIKFAYSLFCKNQGIVDSQREQIIGSEELIKFGASIFYMAPLKRIVGIKKGVPDDSSDAKLSHGLIRVNAGSLVNSVFDPKSLKLLLTNIKTTFLSALVSVDGLLPNALLAVIHFIQIIIIPIISPIIFFLALCEMTTFQGDVFARSVTFFDFYTTNRLSPWWQTTPYITEVAWIHLYVIVYMIFALVELVSFYLAGYDNNGKFNVKFTLLKKFFMYSFYMSLCFFLLLYFSMLWFVLVWAILASIFNPSVYLPYSAAALTLAVTVTSGYQFIQTRLGNLRKDLEKIIAEKIGENFQKSLEKVRKQGESVLGSDKMKGLDKFMPCGPEQTNQMLGEGLEKIFSKMSDFSKGGDEDEKGKNMSLNIASNIAIVISSQLDGISPMLIELLIAIKTKDKEGIKTSVAKIQTEIGIENELLDSLVSVGISDFDPSDYSKQPSFSQLQLNIKRIFRNLDADMPIHEYISVLCKVILERDPSPIVKLIKQIIPDIPNQRNLEHLHRLLNMLMDAHQGEFESLQNNLLVFLESMLRGKHRQYFETFELLVRLRSKDLTPFFKEAQSFTDIPQLPLLLGFKRCYPLMFMVELSAASSSNVSFQVLMTSLKEILHQGKMMTTGEINTIQEQHNTHSQKLSTLEAFSLGIIYLTIGDTIDLRAIAKDINSGTSKIPKAIGQQSIDESKAEMLSRVGQKSADAFEQLLYKLNYTHQKELMMEFYYLMINQERQFKKICGSLGIPVHMEKTYTQLIYLLYYILFYDQLIRDYQTQSPENKKIIERQLISLPDRIFSCLQNLTNFNGEKLVFSDLQAIRKECPQLKMADSEKSFIQMQNAAEYEKFEAEETLLQIQHEESKKNKQKIVIDPKANDKILEKYLYGLVQDIFPASEFMEWDVKDPTKPPESTETITKSSHQELWSCVMRHLNRKKSKTKAFSEDSLSFARQVAIVLLKVNSIIPQKDLVYQKSLGDLSAFLQVDFNGLELCIDCISGNPLEIFKVKNKNIIIYQILPGKQVFNGTFDYERAYLLQQLLSATPQSLNEFFVLWFHQHKQYSQAKAAVISRILPAQGISLEFMELVQSFNMIKRADYDALQQLNFGETIKLYIQTQIRQTRVRLFLKSQKSPKNEKTVYGPQNSCTELLFGDGSNMKYQILRAGKLSNDQLFKILDLFQVTLEILDLDINKLMKLLRIEGPQYNQINFDALMAVLEAAKDMQPHQMINMIIKIAEFVTETRIDNKKMMWTKKEEKLEKAEYIQLAILMNANRIDKLFRQKQPNSMKLSALTSLLLNIKNKTKRKKCKAARLDDKDYQNYLLTLYENNFFEKAERKLIRPAWPDEINSSKIEKYSTNILGLLLGNSLDNKRLIRTSLTSIVADVNIQTHFVEGLISCFQKDTEATLSIKKFAADLGLDGDFLVNLIDLTASGSSSNFTKNIIYMLNTNSHKKDDKLILSFISLFKRDISQARPLIQKLQVDQRKATMLLAAALGDMTILQEFYSDIQHYLGLKSQQTVAYLMQLAHGQTKCIYNLRSLRSKTFCINDPHLFESVFKITYFGRQFTEGRIRHVPENINTDFNYISRKLSKVFGIDDDEIKKRSYSLKRSRTIMENKLWKNDEELTLAKSLSLLLRACWSDSQSIQQITRLFCSTSPLWESFETVLGDQIDEFFVQCLESLKRQNLKAKDAFMEIQMEQLRNLEKAVLPKLLEEVNRRGESVRDDAKNGVLKEKIKAEVVGQNIVEGTKPMVASQEVMKTKRHQKWVYLHEFPINQNALEEKQQNLVNFDEAMKGFKTLVSGRNFPFIKSQQDQLDLNEMLSRIGCTKSIAGSKPVKQPVYNCKTCTENRDDKVEILLCIVCAHLCHLKKGHNIQLASPDSKMHTCRCDLSFKSQDEIQELNTNKCCQIKDEYMQAMVSKASTMVDEMQYIDKNHPYEPIRTYTIKEFLIDLEKSIKLPRYFQELDSNFDDFVEAGNIQSLGRNCWAMKDFSLQLPLTLAQNYILLAQGYPTQTFLGLLSIDDNDKNSYNSANFASHAAFVSFDSPITPDLKTYVTLSAFSAIAQQDNEKIRLYGRGLAQVMEESGGKEDGGSDKLCKVIMLVRGGEIPDHDIFTKGDAHQLQKGSKPQSNLHNQSQKNDYVELIKTIFGINWKPIMTLHKAITVSRKNLLEAFFKGVSTKPDLTQDYLKLDPQKKQVENLRAWLYQTLFAKALNLQSSSVKYCTSMIGIIQNFPPALDFIANERNIPQAKLSLYKTLTLSMQQEEFKQLFKKANNLINERLGNILYTVMAEKSEEWLFILITKYIEIKSKPRERDQSWSKANIEEAPSLIKINWYIKSLHKLMSCESGNSQEDNYDFVITQYLNQYRNLFGKNYLIINSLMAISGILDEDPFLSQKIAGTLGYEAIQENNLLARLINLLKRKAKIDDLQALMPLLSDKITEEDINARTYQNYQDLFKALEGDLVSTASIADMLHNSDSHFRSLIASLLTGKTKFDYLKSEDESTLSMKYHQDVDYSDTEGEEEKAEQKTRQPASSDITKYSKGQNLLLREVFQFYELAVREHFRATHPQDQVESFIKTSFARKIPIYLLVLMAEDKNMLESLIKVEDQFGVGLIKRKHISQLSKEEQEEELGEMKDFIKNFFGFLNSSDPNTSIQPLLRYLLNLKDDDEAQIIQVQPLPSFVMEQEATQERKIQKLQEQEQARIPLHILPFLDLVFKCLTSEDDQSVARLFAEQSFVFQYIQFQPEVVRDVFLILRNLLEKKEDLADQANISKLLKIILISQSMQTNLLSHTKKLNGQHSTSSSDDEADHSKDKKPPAINEARLMSLVPAWFKLINLILSKEKPTSRIKQPYLELQETMKSTLRTTFKYYGSDKLANSPFAKKRENPDYIVEVLTGLICLAKGDLIGCELLAQKLGGFPGDEKGMKKFTEVVELIENNRIGLKFIKEDVTQRVREKADGIVSKMPFGKEIAGDMLAKAMENPGQLFDPQVLFKHFATNGRTIGFEEFNNIFVQLNLKIPYVRMLKIFSEADVKKRGELNFLDFQRALSKIKDHFIFEVMDQLGISMEDMILDLVWSIILLLLMFAFIFVGIIAFSPASSFSSVTNTIMPLAAGVTVNKDKKQEEKPEDLKEAADAMSL